MSMRTVWHNPESMNRRAFLGSMAAIPAAGLLSGCAIGRSSAAVQIVRPKRLAGRRHGRHRRSRERDVPVGGPRRSRASRSRRSDSRSRSASTCCAARLPRRVPTRIAPPTSTRSSRTTASAPCCRSAAAGAAAACCRISTSTRSARNPKIVLGYSDITALHLAIHAKTGLRHLSRSERDWADGTPGRSSTSSACCSTAKR